MLPSVNSDLYTDVDMIEDAQTAIEADSKHTQSLYEHNIEIPHNSDTIPGVATTNKNDLDVCDQNGEVGVINAVDDDKQSVTGTCGSSNIYCSLNDKRDDSSIGARDVTVVSLLGSHDRAVPKVIIGRE